MEEYLHKPCPMKILDDVGAGFTLGCLGQILLQGIPGFVDGPSSVNNSFKWSLSNIRRTAPITGGSFALWGGTYAVIDCTLIHFRQKEDEWNSIISGTATGAILSVRQKWPVMAGQAFVGGLFVVLRIGMEWLLNQRARMSS